MTFGRTLGIDLGTVNTAIANKGKVRLFEPTLIVENTETGHLVFGKEAYRRLCALGPRERAIWPMLNARLNETEYTRKLIEHFLTKKLGYTFDTLGTRRIVLAVASELEPMYRHAALQEAQRFCRGEVILVEQTAAASIANYIDFEKIRSVLLIDIGGGTSCISLRSSSGELIPSASLHIAGNEMDQAIVAWVKRELGIHIGREQARILKERIGWARREHLARPLAVEVRGPNSDGVVQQAWVSSNDIADALSEPINSIVEFCEKYLAQVVASHPDLVSRFVGSKMSERAMEEEFKELIDRDSEVAVLTGGHAFLPGLREVLEKSLSIPTLQIAQEPLHGPAIGASIVAENPTILYKADTKHDISDICMASGSQGQKPSRKLELSFTNLVRKAKAASV